MTLAVYALSIVLVLVGAVCIAAGIPLIYLEQGWTEIIVGSIAVATACLIFTLGVLLSRFDALRVAIEGLSGAGVSSAAVMTLEAPILPPEVPAEADSDHADRMQASRDEVEHVSDMVRPEPALAPEDRVARLEVEPPSAIEGRADPVDGPPLLPPNEVFGAAMAPQPAPKWPNFVSSLLARVPPIRRDRAAASDLSRPPEPVVARLGEPDFSEPAALEPAFEAPDHRASEFASEAEQDAAPPSSRSLSDDHPDRPLVETEVQSAAALEEAPADAAPAPEPAEALAASTIEPPPPGPTVVGRYTAGSASYVMYSNGMIEVETETGTHQFDSMQDLKVFIGKQEANGA